jgi:hypothetical protein
VKRFRTIRGIIPWLIGLFVVAQLSGVVPSRLPHGLPTLNAAAMVMHDHHGHAAAGPSSHSQQHKHNPDGSAGDACCALHLLIAVLTPIPDAAPAGVLSQRVSPTGMDSIAGIRSDRLDRPPRFV